MSYSLLTFGIECDCLRDENKVEIAVEEIRRTQHLQRRMEIEKREEEERLIVEARTGVILHPAPNDVLLGRGRPNQEFSGNRRFVDLVESQMERFRKCSQQWEKTCVIITVVKMVQDTGGRFLSRRTDGWEVVNDAVARKKAGGTFRTRLELAAAAATVYSEPPPTPHTPLSSSSFSSSSIASFEDRAAKRVKYNPNVFRQCI
jgi:hypothetical protein